MTMNELESVYCFEVVLTINGLLVVFTPGEEILQLCNIRILPGSCNQFVPPPVRSPLLNFSSGTRLNLG